MEWMQQIGAWLGCLDRPASPTKFETDYVAADESAVPLRTPGGGATATESRLSPAVKADHAAERLSEAITDAALTAPPQAEEMARQQRIAEAKARADEAARREGELAAEARRVAAAETAAAEARRAAEEEAAAAEAAALLRAAQERAAAEEQARARREQAEDEARAAAVMAAEAKSKAAAAAAAPAGGGEAPGGGKKITCKQCGKVQAKSAFSANQQKKASQGGEARCKACVKASG